MTRLVWESYLEKLNASPFDVTQPEAELVQTNEPMTTFSVLTEFLQRLCHMISSIESSVSSRPLLSNPSGSHISGRTAGRSLRTYTTQASGECSQCHEATHFIGQCEQFLGLQPKGRNTVLRARLCFNSLRAEQPDRSCLSKSVCQVCQALHHTSLHSSGLKRAAINSDAEVPTKQ